MLDSAYESHLRLYTQIANNDHLLTTNGNKKVLVLSCKFLWLRPMLNSMSLQWPLEVEFLGLPRLGTFSLDRKSSGGAAV
jgi:hypothetical protein